MSPNRTPSARPAKRSGTRCIFGAAATAATVVVAVAAVAAVGLGPVIARTAAGEAQAATGPVLHWTTPTTSVSPPPLAYAAAAYDAANSTLVLYGGVQSSGGLSDRTWVWNGQAWKDYSASPGLSGRELASMAYDPKQEKLILFGGEDANGALQNGTWAWNGQTWVSVDNGQTAPPPRDAAAFAYDGSGGLVLFGGTGYSAPTSTSTSTTTLPPISGSQAPAPEVVLGDTWRWTATGWVRSSTTGPSARSGAVLAYAGRGTTAVLFGGESTTVSAPQAKLLSDTWTWNGSKWSQARPAASPSPRYGAVADGDPPAGGALVLSGEGTSGDLSDGWVWTGSTWVQGQITGAEAAREGAAAGYDAATQDLVVFGGAGGGGGTLGDTGLVSVVAPQGTVPKVASTTTTTARPTTTTTLGPHSRSTTPSTVAKSPPTTNGSQVTTPPTSPVATGPLPPGTLLLQTSLHNVRRGTSVRVAGAGFAPSSEVTITFHSAPSVLGRVTTDGSGRFTKWVAVPRNAAAGEHHIVAAGTSPSGGTTQLATTVFVIVAPSKGISTLTTLTLVGLALLLPVGAYLAMAGAGVWRRRRQTASEGR